MWYLPVIDRLKRLFSNPNNAKLMMWHDNRPLKNDGSFDTHLMLASGRLLMPIMSSLETKKGMYDSR